MSQGLRIRLRPTGPWRIGPDSGERDRTGTVFHSDALYSAVCGAMLRLGLLEDWLAATARSDVPRIRFTSLFPWQGNTFFLPAPHGIWPPIPSSKLYTRGALFVPRAVANAVFHGKPLDESRWQVDGVSQCLLPSSGRGPGSGPFRPAIRAGGAVDRLAAGNTEVHRTACIEFSPNAGLWFIAEFSDGARREWEPRLMAALRLLADSGFGGRRSVGWGHADIVEATFGSMVELILGPPPAVEPVLAPVIVLPVSPEPEAMESEVRERSAEAPLLVAEPPDAGKQADPPEQIREGEVEEPAPEPAVPTENPPSEELTTAGEVTLSGDSTSPAELTASPEAGPQTEVLPAGGATPLVPEPTQEATEAAVAELELSRPAEPEALPEAPPPEPAAAVPTAWYLLSLFTPGSSDSIDWQRGAYSLVERTGRVDSPQGSGQVKKSLRMVVEGSLLFAPSAPVGAASDVAPEGFFHPVFRSGFAVSIAVPYRGTV
jgi:CRISPR/Cas system CSM-associated protein Csm4 (group 5 of RAMP superfamily)